MSAVPYFGRCREAKSLVQRRCLRSACAETKNLERRLRELDDTARQRCSYGSTSILGKDIEIPQTPNCSLPLIGVAHKAANRHEAIINEVTEERLALSHEPVRASLPLAHDAPEKPKALRLRGNEKRTDLVARQIEKRNSRRGHLIFQFSGRRADAPGSARIGNLESGPVSHR